MAGILWLASYPKSGNTWLRIFFANLFADGQSAYDINDLGRYFFGEMSADLYEHVAGKSVTAMSDYEIHQLRPRVHQLLTSLRPETVIVKTHNAIAERDGISTVTPGATEGAIYVVRNPLDVVISYADHYGLSVDNAIDAMASPENRVVTAPTAVFQYLGDWSRHVHSWSRADGLRCHVVRYEDLSNKPVDSFAAITAFLGMKVPRGRVRRAVRNASFKEVKRQERKRGFAEKSRHAEAFFRQGKTNQWRNNLSAEQVERIVASHGETMAEFGYLPHN